MARERLHFVAECDGSSKSPKGPAGLGIVLTSVTGGRVTISWPIGAHTNNIAEYQAIIMALRVALSVGGTSIMVKTDSELTVRQIKGEYAVHTPHLQPLRDEARRLLGYFSDGARIKWIPREQNQAADDLAGLASSVVSPIE